jgi:hypothetical protein
MESYGIRVQRFARGNQDVVSVHRKEIGELALSPAGGYEFLAGN